jgi:hypothetical protein
MIALPAGRLLTDVTAAAVDADLKRMFLSDSVDTSINGFLVNTGSKLVLIDAGAGRQAVFANAIVRAARKEAEYWLSSERMAAAPPEAQAGFRNAVDALAPYIKAGRFSTFDDGAALLPGNYSMPH